MSENADLNMAIQYHKAGQFALAAKLYSDIIERDPGNFDALHMLGMINYQSGDADTAIRLLNRAVSVRNDSFECFLNLGTVLQSTGDMDGAIAAFERGAALNPRYSLSYYKLGCALYAHGRLEPAGNAFQCALRLSPELVDTHVALGIVQSSLGYLDAAISSFKKALEFKPDLPDVCLYLGRIMAMRGMPGEAVEYFRRGITLQPSDPQAYGDLGQALQQLGRPIEAIGAYQKALELKPEAAVYSNLTSAYEKVGLLDEAEASIRHALNLMPDSAAGFNNLGNVLKNQGRTTEAIDCYRRAIDLKPDFHGAHSNFLLCLNYAVDSSPIVLRQEHERWAMLHASGIPSRKKHSNDRNPDRRLRIGYVSPDIHEHPVAHFLEPIIANHNRDRFEILCYADVRRPDGVTRRFQSYCSEWRNICGMRDEQVVAAVSTDKIDILVDLAGHTAGNRLLVFQAKPAPVQVAYLGYANTSGLSTIDYRLTDKIADLPGDERYYTEQLCYLASGFSCYAPPDGLPDISPLPARKEGIVTFGSLNGLLKINAAVLDLWCRVLQAVPSSRIIIFRNLLKGEMRERYLQAFLQRGIAADRVHLLSNSPPDTRAFPAGLKYLSAYDQIDIALDTFPWSSHTTACESLWMGVPVISLYGDRHAGRLVASVLSAVSLNWLIARTADDYVRIAAQIASDTDTLEFLRQGLRESMRKSALCDGVAFTGLLEDAYRKMWRKWCALACSDA